MTPHPFTYRMFFANGLAAILTSSALLISTSAMAQSPAASGSVFNVFANDSICTKHSFSSTPATILLNATASDSDGSISKVDFYNGNSLIASASQAPYNTQWANVGTGSYTLTAIATDNLGASTISTAITVSVASAAAKIYDIQTDQINTPRVITDSTGNVVWRWDSLPFGESLADENPQRSGTANDFKFNLRFPGQYYDEETGLHYNYFRDYEPGTGRYIQSDPIGLSGGINTYAYVGGNPVSKVDPVGEIGLLGAAVGAGIEIAKEIIVDGKSLRCVNIGNVVVSAAAGAFGPGLITVGKSAAGMSVGALAEFGTRDLAIWQGLVTFPATLIKKEKIRWTIGSDCECQQ